MIRYNYYSNTTIPSHGWVEKDGVIEYEMKLPGINKGEIEIKYSEENNSINVFVKDKVDHDVYFSRRVDPDKITASLKLGILLIKAPIKDTDKSIQIE